jgi:WD40 repeat protein
MDKRDPSAEEGALSVDFTFLAMPDRGDCSQIMDLENRNASLQEEVSMSPTKRAALQTDWVPRAPAAYTLTGHRDQVLRVAFHPSYNIIASASDDSTVKIWDWETGEFERTLKGHTRSVNDVDFDSKGNLLGESSLLWPRPWLTKWSSHLFVRFVHQSMGHSKRLEECQDNGRA